MTTQNLHEISSAGKRGRKKKYICSCGTVKWINAWNVESGRVNSCGHLTKDLQANQAAQANNTPLLLTDKARKALDKSLFQNLSALEFRDIIPRMQIVYIPDHVWKEAPVAPLSHDDIEYGFITSTRPRSNLIYCRYFLKDKFELRTKANSEVTPVENLHLCHCHDQRDIDRLYNEVTNFETAAKSIDPWALYRISQAALLAIQEDNPNFFLADLVYQYLGNAYPLTIITKVLQNFTLSQIQLAISRRENLALTI